MSLLTMTSPVIPTTTTPPSVEVITENTWEEWLLMWETPNVNYHTFKGQFPEKWYFTNIQMTPVGRANYVYRFKDGNLDSYDIIYRNLDYDKAQCLVIDVVLSLIQSKQISQNLSGNDQFEFILKNGWMLSIIETGLPNGVEIDYMVNLAFTKTDQVSVSMEDVCSPTVKVDKP